MKKKNITILEIETQTHVFRVSISPNSLLLCGVALALFLIWMVK